MPRRIALGYDGSPAARTCVDAAADLLPGAEVHVVCAHEPPMRIGRALQAGGALVSEELLLRGIEDLRRQAADAASATAAEGVARAEASGLAARPAPVETGGRTWEAILGTAREMDADVIACGSRGLGAVSRSLLGSTSASLLHHADRPLLVVAQGGGASGGPAILAYDGSAGAREAIATAGRLLSGRAAIVVHAWESAMLHSRSVRALANAPFPEVGEVAADLHAWMAEGAEAITAEGVELAREAGLAADGETAESPEAAWRGVADVARRRAAAVIVAGSRGLGNVASALLGSVSSGLVHAADLPVLVVKQPS